MADAIAGRNRIFCITLTHYPVPNLEALSNTWTQRCDGHVGVPVKDYSDKRFAEYMTVTWHTAGYEWLLIVRDETFIVLENLRWLLDQRSNESVHYFSSEYDKGNDVRFGAFVMSRGVSREFEHLFKNVESCRKGRCRILLHLGT